MNSAEKQRQYFERWRDKKRTDPGKWQKHLARARERAQAYRESRCPKYLAQIERKRMRRELNPFPNRQKRRMRYQHLKREDPVAYQAYLKKQKDNYAARMKRLRENPAAYHQWLNDKMVYFRYRRIVVANREVAA